MIENDYTESDYYVSFDAVFRAIDEYWVLWLSTHMG